MNDFLYSVILPRGFAICFSARSRFDAVAIEEIIVLVGGMCNNPHRNTLEIFRPTLIEERHEETGACSDRLQVPKDPRYNHCTAVLNGKIYFIGGKQQDESMNLKKCKFMFCFMLLPFILRHCCWVVSYSDVFCCPVLCCTVLYCTVLCCIVMCCIALYCTVLYCTVLYCVVLYCTVLSCAVPCCAPLR